MRKLAWFSGGFAGVCLLCCYGPDGLYRPLLAALGLLALLAGVLGRAARRQTPPPRLFPALRRGLALCLGGVLAAGWFWGWTALFQAPAAALAGQTLTLSGQVTGYPTATSIGGCTLTLRLDGGLTAPDLLVYGTSHWAELEPGDRVTFTAQLSAADRVRGEETTYHTAKGVFLLAVCDEAPTSVERPPRPPLSTWPARCAHALKGSLAAAFDAGVAPLLTAIATGDKSGLSDWLTTCLNRSGASHLAVVSGMHISCLVSVVMLLARNRRRWALLCLPLLLFYALMAGGTPSALRAVVMQGVLLAAPLARREHDSPTALAFALLLLLLANPYAAGSVSLQLSFTSVAGILAASPPLLARVLPAIKALGGGKKSRGWNALRRGLRLGALSLSVSLGAMVFSQPLLALYFQRASLLFPLTNLLVLWAVSLLLPLALVVGTAGLFLPGAAQALAVLVAPLARYVIGVVTLLGRWWFSAIDLSAPYYPLCLVAVYLFLAAGLVWRKAGLRPLLPAGCLVLLLGSALLLNRWPFSQAELTIAALDVGQGAATVFLSDGSVCLVDCGGNGADNAGDTAADYCAGLGLSRLEALVLTHFDDDHVNGVEELFHRMEVETVYLPDVDGPDGRREEILALAAAEGAEVVYVTQVTERPLGRAVLTLYPPLGSGTSNEEGLFALCSAGDFDGLVTGDADYFVEKMLLKYYNIPDLELLAAGHHGAASSTCDELLDGLLPELAVISCGYNSYGHPAPATLERLAQRGIETYRTDAMGTVTIYVRSDGYAAQSQG